MRRTNVLVYAAYSLRIEEQLQNVANCSRRNVLSSLVSSCANANSRRNAKLSTKTGVLRHETGRLGEDSEPIQVLACPQEPRSAATWRHVGCGRLQVLRLFSVDQALQRHLHRTSEPREVMRAFREAKVPKAMSCAEIRAGLTS